jgi:hypothetical protein
MNTHVIRPILASVVVVFSMLACNFGQKAAPTATPSPEEAVTEAVSTAAPAATEAATTAPTEMATTACENAYLPPIVGAKWNYKISGPTPDTYTHTVLAVDSDSFTEQDVFGVGVTRQGKWTCESGNLIALNPSSGDSGTVQAQNVQVNLETKEHSGITLPAKMNAGDTWSQTLLLEGTETINGTELPAKNEFSNDCTAKGVESVTVEAGTFDAMRVECKTVMHLTVTIAGKDTAATFNLTGTSWYAENIGMVKNTTTGMGFDSTTELVSYDIPK